MKYVVILLTLAASGYGQWITGYYGAQNGVLPASKIPWNKYSHVIHFAATPGVDAAGTGNGTISLNYLTQPEINELISSKPSGKSVLVCLKDNDSSLHAFAQSTSPAVIATFVNNLAFFITSNRYDGIDIDWEANINVAQFQDLLTRLRAALPGKLITMAAGDWGGMETVAAASQANLDQVNVMCYDMDNGANCNGQECTWHNDALFQAGQNDKRTCDARVRSFTSKGLSNSKIGIGVPFYARTRTGATQPQTMGAFLSRTLPYRTLVTDSARWQGAHKRYDSTFKADFLSIPTLNEFVTYTGASFVNDVVAWQKAQKFGGFMTFTLDYEYVPTGAGDASYPLSTLLHNAVTGPPAIPNPAAPTLSAGTPTGTLAATTASAVLSVTTDVNATCAYSTKAETAYSLMPYIFATTGGLSHSAPVTSLQSGSTYAYYVRCSAAGAVNTSDYPISFSLAQAPVPAPAPLSVKPASGSGVSQQFKWRISDPAGYSDVQQVAVVIDTAVGRTNSCWLEYWAPTKTLFLKSDNGTTWAQAILGTSSVLHNSQCSIDPAASSVSGTGNTLSVNLAMAFTQAYTGNKSMFVFTGNVAGISSGWLTFGSWTVPVVPPPEGPVMTISPANGMGASAKFELGISNSTASAIQQVDLMFGPFAFAATESSCWIEYWAPSKTLFLRADNKTQWYPAALGSQLVLHNSLCAIDMRLADVTGSGPALTLTLSVAFSKIAAGRELAISTLAADANGKNAGWQSVGSWTIK